jgi:potassium-dependent mechanosensitive channel
VVLGRLLSIVALVLALGIGPVFAQSTSDAQVTSIEAKLESLRGRLRAIEAIAIEQLQTDEMMANQKTAIESVQLDAAAETAKLRGPVNEVEAQLARIGAPPADGTLEPPALAAQRRVLETRAARLAAAQKQFELIGFDASQQLAKNTTTQRQQFFERIFKSEKSILNLRLWIDAGAGLWALVGNFGRTVEDTYKYARNNANPVGLLLLPLIAMVIYGLWAFAHNRIISGFGREPIRSNEDGEDTAAQMAPLERLWRALLGLLGMVVLVLIGFIVIRASIEAADVATPNAMAYVNSVLAVVTSAIIYSGVTYFLCAPRNPETRLIAVDDKSARILPVLVGAAALVSSIGNEMPQLFDTLRLPQGGLAGQSALVAIVMISLIGLITAVIQNQAKLSQAEGSSYYLAWFVRFLPLIWVVLAAAVIALLLGYIALAYFITGSILDTALFIISLALIHSLADGFSEVLQNPISKTGQLLRQFTGLTELSLSRIALVFRTGIDILLVVIAVPVLFVIWALTWIDLKAIFGWVYNGVTIGNITLSPWGILVAIAVFVIGVVLTRAITGWMQRRVLSETTLDKGVQDSVRTGASYLGYIIAASFGLSAAGLDFSNIAIIAGALGVGIGFGLQSIVNNFVSGLILLAERPVRVGDWVVTNAGEGIVRKINVRSTEIETFDNCTVIVPNSNLITEAVKNWTHRDTIGRFSVSFVVEPLSKPQTIVEILKSAATNHPKILRYPEAVVRLTRFFNGGIEFELKGSVADVFEGATVASDIRMIVAAELSKRKINLLGAPK